MINKLVDKRSDLLKVIKKYQKIFNRYCQIRYIISI